MGVLDYLSLFMLILTFAGFSRIIWWLTILDFFRLQYGVTGLVLLSASIYQASWLAAIFSFIIILVNFYRIRHFPPIFWKKCSEDQQIICVNAYANNKQLEKLAAYLEEASPTLLLILEMNEELEKALDNILPRYPHRLEAYVRDGFSICLLSQNKLENTAITGHGPSDTPLLHAQIKLRDRVFQVYAAHPKPALSKKWYKERWAYFKQIEPVIAKANLPVLMLGDFNSVPWENHFVRFLKNTGLKSTLEEHGYKITWPVFFPLLGIPMDHILISRGQGYKTLNVGPFVGSDHYPISTSL